MAGNLGVRIELNEADLKAVMKKLDKLKANTPKSVSNALNRVARGARQQMVARARATYMFKPGFRVGNITLHAANVGMLVATLEAQTKTRTARQFDWAGGYPEGISMRLLKSGSMKPLVNKAGNKAFMNNAVQDGLIMQRIGKARDKLRAPRGASEADMYKQAWVGAHGGGPMEGLVQQRLMRELNAEIAKLM